MTDPFVFWRIAVQKPASCAAKQWFLEALHALGECPSYARMPSEAQVVIRRKVGQCGRASRLESREPSQGAPLLPPVQARLQLLLEHRGGCEGGEEGADRGALVAKVGGTQADLFRTSCGPTM